jgi:hypothetical protein
MKRVPSKLIESGSAKVALYATVAIAAGAAVILAATDLAETPDTSCGTLLSPPTSATICRDVVFRRGAYTAAAAVLAIVALLVARRLGQSAPSTSRWIFVVASLGVVAGLWGVGA